LADGVYRTDTKLGQPLVSSCVPGSEPIEVRYASKYCELDFFFRLGEVDKSDQSFFFFLGWVGLIGGSIKN
jgi:hypothetical protein